MRIMFQFTCTTSHYLFKEWYSHIHRRLEVKATYYECKNSQLSYKGCYILELCQKIKYKVKQEGIFIDF